MPNLGVFHPQVVHFAIALLIVGVLLRVISVFFRHTWVNPAAATLLILGTLAAVVSVRSGDDAHSPVERVPGARPAVVEHEEWGERTRNVFLIVSAIELLALALAPERRRFARMAAAALGLFGVYAVYETGEHGGELVYSYAGGVGIRTGDTADVSRLLLAGLYHQAMLDRREGRGTAAADLFDQMAKRFPDDTSIRLLAIESTLRDRGDVAGARAAIEGLMPPPTETRTSRAVALLKVDILAAAGHRDSARAILEPLVEATPANARLRAKLDSLK
jgi:uncharacterized membrane protein